MKNKLILFTFFLFIQFCFCQIGFVEKSISVSQNSAKLFKIDIENDGDQDLIIAISNQIFLYENLGQNAFFSQEQLLIENLNTNADNGLQILRVNDLDMDGDQDILVSLKVGNFNGPYDFFWYENTGNKNFTQSPIIDTITDPFYITIFDFDSDGDKDIIENHFVNLSPTNDMVFLYENLDGQNTYGNKQQILSNLNPLVIFIADIDSDNDIDLLCHTINSENYWIENVNGNYNNQHFILSSSTPKFPFPTDLNNDGIVDLLFVSNIDINNPTQLDGIIDWYSNSDGLGTFAFEQQLIDNPNILYIPNIGDIDSDGDTDVLTVSDSDVLLFENIDGLGTFTNEQIISDSGFSNSELLLTDVDGDGDVDLLINQIINNQIIWFENLDLGNEISGLIMYDTENNSCSQNSVELSGLLISSINGQNIFSSISNQNGYFQIATNEGDFTTQIQNLPAYFSSVPLSALTEFQDLGNTDIIDFCIESTSTVNDLNIYIVPPTDEPRPGFDTSYQIIYSNIGTTQLSGDVTFQFDDSKIQFLNASETVASQTLNSLTFNYSNLNPFETRTIDLDFNVFPPPTTNIDEILVSTATISPVTGDETQDDNTFTLDQVVIGSYDPNDIQILEGNQVHIDDADEYLHFLIRFQNTGTASAINVRVEHTFDNKLDWTTIQLLSMSHQGRVEITNGSDVQFIFNNINLPDSTSDEPNSHGFITFKIKPLDNLVVGDIISGVADIYFDFNPPIITNTATTEYIDNLNSVSFEVAQISVYPNPTNGGLNISSNTTIDKIEVIDMLGRIVLTESHNDANYLINLSTLQDGIYFLKIKSRNTLETKKIIKN